MQEKVAEIERLMIHLLDGMQMRHLHAVLASCLCGSAPVIEPMRCDDAQNCIDAFLFSEKTRRVLGTIAWILLNHFKKIRQVD